MGVLVHKDRFKFLFNYLRHDHARFKNKTNECLGNGISFIPKIILFNSAEWSLFAYRREIKKSHNNLETNLKASAKACPKVINEPLALSEKLLLNINMEPYVVF